MMRVGTKRKEKMRYGSHFAVFSSRTTYIDLLDLDQFDRSIFLKFDF